MAARSTPTVSVIIPTYNRAALIGKAISSVLVQTYKDFELIVVDDGSSDETVDVITSFRDERIVFLRQENRGRSAARNRAIAVSRGRYVAFLDSDDEYLDHKLEQQVAYMDAHPAIGMVYTSAHCIDEQGQLLRHSYVASVAGNIYKEIAFFQPVTITLPTVMVRREVLSEVGLFDEAMERFEDTDLWRRIAKKFQVGVIRQPTCNLRTHSGNVLTSQNAGKIVEAIEYYVTKIFRDDTDVGSVFLRRGASCLFEYYGKAFLSVPGWRRRGFVLLGRSIAFAPGRGVGVVLAGCKVIVRSFIQQFSAR